MLRSLCVVLKAAGVIGNPVPDRCRRLFRSLLPLIGLFLFPGAAHAVLDTAVTVSPDPAPAGSRIQVQVTVTNPTGSPSGDVRLELAFPANLNGLSDVAISDFGNCTDLINSGACNSGETLIWDVGTLVAGAGKTVSLPPVIASEVSDGTEIVFAAQAFENNVPVATASGFVTVESPSALSLNVDAGSDPVAAGSELTYVLTYGNHSASATMSTELRFPLPPGTTFVSASSTGTQVGNDVVWNIGDLGSGDSGRERVTVLLGSGLADGDIVEVSDATLSGEANFVTHEARATAATRVDTPPPLRLAISANPDPIGPDEFLQAHLTVTNPSASIQTGVTIELLYPGFLGSLSDVAISDFGNCTDLINSGACNSGETLIWDVGILPPGRGKTVSFPAELSGAPDGTLVPLRARVFADSTLDLWERRSVAVDEGRQLNLAIDPGQDPVAPGGQLFYTLTFGNRGANGLTNTEMRVPLPPGTTLVSISGGGSQVGNEAVWLLGNLTSGGGGQRTMGVTVDGGAGDGEILLIDSATLSGDGVSDTEKTRANTATRVMTGSRLGYSLSVDPSAEQNTQLSADATVDNQSGAQMNGVTLRLFYPGRLNAISDGLISDSGDCTDLINSGACNSGETVVWDIGILPAGALKVVSIPPVIRSDALDGELIRFFGFATNDAGDRTFVRATTRIGAANDFDNDGIQDADDLDDDNDGIPDDFENANGLNPFDPSDASADNDNDGLDNLGEFNAGTNLNDPDSDGDGIGDAFDSDLASSNLCSGANAVLANQGVLNGQRLQCAAENSIAVRSTVDINSGGRLDLISPQVSFAKGFSIPVGGELKVNASDPTPS